MRLLLVGLLFSSIAFAAELVIFRTPAELLPMFFADKIYGNNDVVTACIFDEPGTQYLLTMTRNKTTFQDFGLVDQYGRYCKVYTFLVSERHLNSKFRAQKFTPVDEPLKPLF